MGFVIPFLHTLPVPVLEVSPHGHFTVTYVTDTDRQRSSHNELIGAGQCGSHDQHLQTLWRGLGPATVRSPIPAAMEGAGPSLQTWNHLKQASQPIKYHKMCVHVATSCNDQVRDGVQRVNQNKFLHASNAIEPQVCINCFFFEIKTPPQPMVIICPFRI